MFFSINFIFIQNSFYLLFKKNILQKVCKKKKCIEIVELIYFFLKLIYSIGLYTKYQCFFYKVKIKISKY